MDLDFSCIQYPNPTLLQGAACRGLHLSSLPRWALSCSTLIGSIVCWLRSQNILNIPPSVSTVIIGCNVLQKYRFHILSLRASVSMGLVTLPTNMSCQGGVVVWSSFQNSGASFKHLGEVQATLQDGQGLSTVIVQGYVYAASPARLPQVKRPQSANSLAPSPSYKQPSYPHIRCPARSPIVIHHDAPQLRSSLHGQLLSASQGAWAYLSTHLHAATLSRSFPGSLFQPRSSHSFQELSGTPWS